MNTTLKATANYNVYLPNLTRLAVLATIFGASICSAESASDSSVKSVVDEFYKESKSNYHQVKHEQNLFALRELVKRDAGSRGAKVLADILVRQASTQEECRRVLRAYLAVHPNESYTRFQYAEVCSWSNSWRAESMSSIQKLLAETPNVAQYHLLRAKLLLWSGKWNESRKEFETCLKLNPSYAEAKLEYARMLSYRPEHLNDSLKVIDQTLSKMPKSGKGSAGSGDLSANFSLEKAVILAIEGKHAESQKILDALCKSHPFDISTTFQIAHKFIKAPPILIKAETSLWQGKLDLAKEYYSEYLKKYPHDLLVRTAYTNLLMLSADTLEEAISSYRELLKEDPNNNEARVRLAQILGWKGHAAEGLQLLNELPSNAEPVTVDEKLLGESGKYPVLVLAAILATESGNFAIAEENWRRYLETEPTNARAKLLLAQTLSYDPAKQSEALLLMNEIFDSGSFKLTDSPVDLLSDYARLLADKHEYARAVEVVQLAMTKVSETDLKTKDQLMLDESSFSLYGPDKNTALNQLINLSQNSEFPTVVAGAKYRLCVYRTYIPAQRADAINGLMELLKSDPENTEYSKALAEAFYWNKQYEDAVKTFRKTNYFSCIYAKSLFELDQPDAAISVCQNIWKNPEASVEQKHDLIMTLLIHNQSAVALNWLDTVNAGSLDSPLYLDYLASSLEQSKEVDISKLFADRHAQFPSQFLHDYEENFLGQDNLRAFLTLCARESLSRDAKDPVALKTLGIMLSWNQKTFSDSLGVLEKYLYAKPDDFDVRVIYAYLLYWEGRSKDSSQQFEMVLRKEPENLAALKGWSEVNVWNSQKDLRRLAHERLSRLAEKDSTDKHLNSLLAQSLEANGDLTNALEKYRKIYEQTGSEKAHSAYATLLTRSRQMDKGYKEFKSILKNDPNNREALLGVAFVLTIRGMELGSEKILKHARELYPNDPEIELASARNFLALGRLDKADDYVNLAFQHASGRIKL